MIASGPVLSGCSVAKDGKSMTITFNSSLLKVQHALQLLGLVINCICAHGCTQGESVGFNSANTIEKEDTALYVLVNDSVDTTSASFTASMVANHGPIINGPPQVTSCREVVCHPCTTHIPDPVHHSHP